MLEPNRHKRPRRDGDAPGSAFHIGESSASAEIFGKRKVLAGKRYSREGAAERRCAAKRAGSGANHVEFVPRGAI